MNTLRLITRGLRLFGFASLAALVLVAAVAALVAFAFGLFAPAVTAAPGLTQLTTGGCCTRPTWSADSRQVLYLDKPDPGAPVGIYGVDVTRPLSPTLITRRITVYLRNMTLALDLKPGVTTLENLADGRRWTAPAKGRLVTVSPNAKRLAWEEATVAFPPEARVTHIRTANFDGSDARTTATVERGSVSGWVSDDVLLVSGRDSLRSKEQVLWAVDVVTGERKELARGEQLRGGDVSPDGAWLVYSVAPYPDPAKNGLWLVKTDGTGRFRCPPGLFGAVQWRDAHRLVILPFRPAAEFHEVWELDAATRQSRRLVDPEVTPIKINDGDWLASPDGRSVVFVAEHDRNFYLLPLPE